MMPNMILLATFLHCVWTGPYGLTQGHAKKPRLVDRVSLHMVTKVRISLHTCGSIKIFTKTNHLFQIYTMIDLGHL